MSGDLALTKVLPNVANITEAQLRSVGGSLALGLPQTSQTASDVFTQTSSTNTATAGGVDTTTGASGAGNTSTQTTTKGPGVVPTPPSGVPAAAAALTLTAPTGTLGLDPVLLYQQANNLNQYVQLRNHELAAAVQRDCYVPYLVTLKLAVSIYRPHLAYALHTHGSFFEARQGNAPAPSGDCVYYADAVPIVVPILVSDDVLVSTRSRSQEAAQQVAAMLSVMSHGVGGALGANWLNQQIQAIQSQDLSSPVTVTRLTDNTLYVRVAPSNEGSGQPALVGKTYDIDVVLLVPKPYFDSKPPGVKLDTVTEFRNVLDGTLLPIRSPSATLARFDGAMAQVVEQFGLRATWAATTPEQRMAAANHLVDLIQSDDAVAFNEAVKCPVTWDPQNPKCPDGDPLAFAGSDKPRYRNSVWTAVAALIADKPNKSLALVFSTPKAMRIASQSALALDDGKTAATVLLHNVDASGINGLTALLDLFPVDAGGAPGPELQLPAATLKFDVASHSLALTFPSPSVWGVNKIDPSKSKLLFDVVGCDAKRSLCPSLSVAGVERGDDPSAAVLANLSLGARLQPAPKPEGTPADFKSTQDVTEIEAVNHAGFASITLPDLPDGETVSISAIGASLTGVTDEKKNALSVSQGAYTAASKGLYVLSFQNLKPDSQVAVTLQGIKAKVKVGSSTVTFHVAATK